MGKRLHKSKYHRVDYNYTGHSDAKKNLIYENDLVYVYPEKSVAQVVYNSDEEDYVLEFGKYYLTFDLFYDTDLRVFGNTSKTLDSYSNFIKLLKGDL